MAPRDEHSGRVDAKATKAPAARAELPSFTKAEIKQRQDLMIVGDQVYSAKKFQSAHPGGSLFVGLFGGRDATEAFMEYHSRQFPHDMMSEYKVGTLHTAEKPTPMDKDYLELSKQVLKLVPNRGFAPTKYWFKLAFILGCAFATEWYLFFKSRTLLGHALLGLIYASIGLNIQHDANHGTLSRSATVNWAFGLMQDWIGGSSILWLQEHVVGHHLHTNDTELDPDITAAAPTVKLNPKEPHLPWYSLQHLYLFPGIPMFGFKLVFADFIELVRFQWVGDKISALANYMYWPSILLKLGFYLRFIGLPLYQAPTLHTVACFCLTTMVASGYLAFFFVLSHNFDGVGHIGEGGELTRDDSFMKRQVETSSNVGGELLAVVNGGLNYQIEHHLFPRIHHAHYTTIAPTVRAYCEKKGFKYHHYSTISQNLRALVSHVYKLGRPDGKFSLTRTVDIVCKILMDKHD